MSPKTRMTSGMQRRKGNDPALQRSPGGRSPRKKEAPTSRLGRDGSPGKADSRSEKGEGRSQGRQGSLPGLDTAAQPERLTGQQE